MFSLKMDKLKALKGRYRKLAGELYYLEVCGAV